MRNPFRSKYRITQTFANKLIINGKEYYKQFGLLGHEGLDLVPTGTVNDVLCVEDGVVVRDIDDATLGKNYGKNVTIWHPNIRKATQYCHLAENNVKMGDRLNRGDKLGVMGATGNTMGAHLHLNLFDVDSNGIRLNRDNGYFGGIDPLPFLEEDTTTIDNHQAIEDKLRAERDSHWNTLVALYNALGVAHNNEVALAEIEKLVKLDDTLLEKEKNLEQANIKIADLEVNAKKLSEVNDNLIYENEKLKSEIEEQKDTITKQGFNINTLKEQIQDIKASAKLPIFMGWKRRIVEFIARL